MINIKFFEIQLYALHFYIISYTKFCKTTFLFLLNVTVATKSNQLHHKNMYNLPSKRNVLLKPSAVNTYDYLPKKTDENDMVVAKVPKSDWFKLEKSFSASVSCGQSKRNHYFHQHEKFHDRLIYYYYFVSIAKNFVAESMNREVRCFGWHTPEYQLIELANETRIFTIKIERIQHFILRIFIRLASLLSLTFLLVVFFCWSLCSVHRIRMAICFA